MCHGLSPSYICRQSKERNTGLRWVQRKILQILWYFLSTSATLFQMTFQFIIGGLIVLLFGFYISHLQLLTLSINCHNFVFQWNVLTAMGFFCQYFHLKNSTNSLTSMFYQKDLTRKCLTHPRMQH